MMLALAAVVLSSGGLYEPIRTWTGGELDHLGIGISSLGDVNGDGYADFILGKMTGAYTFAFGPGAARVISGKDGSLLYEVRGTDKEGDCGDAYGDTIVPLGDLDGDGAPDFAVGAWRYNSYEGYVTVYSGRDGRPLATFYGKSPARRNEGPVPPQDCDFFQGGGIGEWIANVSDLDGDSVPDFAIGEDFFPDNRSRLISGAHFSGIGVVPGIAMGRTGDFDGDGRRDIACLTGNFDELSLTLCSAADRRELSVIPLKGRFRQQKPVGTCVAPVGDLDGDGFLDLLTVETDVGDVPAEPKPVVPIRVRWTSGRTGKVLHEIELDPGAYTQWVDSSPIGDVDGDGLIDVFLQANLTQAGSKHWVLSGKGTVLGEATSASVTEARRVVRLRGLDGDDSIRILVSEYESQAGARCGGAVHLAQLTLPKK